MNQLSWPTTILLGILLGLAAVAADRSVDPPQASAPDPKTSQPPAPSGGGGGGDVETNPDTGGVPVSADEYVLTLTFDDGPNPTYTPQVLDLLDSHDATAVFCVIGKRVREHPEVVRQIVDAGHALCIHTYTHDEQLSERNRDEIDKEISDTIDAIEAAVGDQTDVRFFRQPNTHVQPQVRPAIDEFRLEPLDWTIDPRDWSRPGSMSIVQDVLNQIRPGAVVLLHDGGGDRSQTVTALEQILDGLDAAGYRHVLPGESP